jgi:hypothetical protein
MHRRRGSAAFLKSSITCRDHGDAYCYPIGIKMLRRILSLFSSNSSDDTGDRIKCSQCRNRVLVNIAASNGGLCGVCHRRKHPRPERDMTKPSPYHQLLDTPVGQLDDGQKRDQLSGAISWKNEARINQLLSGDTSFLSKRAKYSSETWLGQAVKNDCSIAVLESLLAVGCDPNGYLKSPNESRPLEIAVSNDRIEAIRWLLAHGADPNIGRPLVAAINHEKSPDLQLVMLRLLLDGGANINQTYQLFGDETKRFSVLDWALLYRVSDDVIGYLKSRGAIHQWTDDKIAATQRELKPRRIVP